MPKCVGSSGTLVPAGCARTHEGDAATDVSSIAVIAVTLAIDIDWPSRAYVVEITHRSASRNAVLLGAEQVGMNNGLPLGISRASRNQTCPRFDE